MRHKLIFAVFFFILVSLTLVSCSDDPSSIGSDLLGADEIEIEQVNSLTDSISQTSFSILKHVPLGSSNRLLVGRKANVEASFLIRFAFAFPDSVKQSILADSIQVNSARVQFTRIYTFGNNTDPLDINVQKVNSSWSSTGFTADSLPNLQTSDILTDSLSITDSTTSFNIDNAVVLNWLKNSADPSYGDNWGLYLKPGVSAAKIYGYQSLISSAEDVPTIQIVIEKAGSFTDTLNFIPVADISVLDDIAPAPSGEFITIQSGLKIMSYLNFNMSSLPRYAIINKAELILTSDTTQNITAGDPNNIIVGYIPKDSTSLDSIASPTVNFVKSENIYTGNITSLVQNWLVLQNNRGLVLTTSNELNGLERFVIFGSNASDPAVRPRLIITYTNKL